MALSDLPVLGARPRGPLPKGKSRLDEAEAATKADEQLLEAWRKAVKARDGNRCRCCKRKVIVTLKLQASRAECHHLTGRVHKPTRYDVRNGILLCASCHQRVERNELQITGTLQFRIGPREYLDASGPVTFKELI